jgi:hypothetical protein
MPYTWASPRLTKLFTLVETLYHSTARPEASYLWNSHVQEVARFAGELSSRFGADQDTAVAGALLHDIADIWLDRSEPSFEDTTTKTAIELLTQAGYNESEITFVMDQVIAPHSCYPGNLPTTLEGKVMATADAMAHLTSNFYREVYPLFFAKKKTVAEFNDWVRGKLDRDFNSKIFFAEVKEEVRGDYEKLMSEFKADK